MGIAMAAQRELGLDALVDVLKAAGEPTRMRLVALLAAGDLTVTDLTEILGQSQPRISRHLKLLAEVELIDRYQEGAWAYFRLRQDGARVGLVRAMLAAASAGDAVLSRDAARLTTLKKARAEKAQAYFSRNAAGWDELRRLHVSERDVEAKLREMVGDEPVESLLDLGTGTGRILQLFEGLYRRGVGVDASRDMLAVARSISIAPASPRPRSATATSSICRSTDRPSISSPSTRCCISSTSRRRRSRKLRAC